MKKSQTMMVIGLLVGVLTGTSMMAQWDNAYDNYIFRQNIDQMVSPIQIPPQNVVPTPNPAQNNNSQSQFNAWIKKGDQFREAVKARDWSSAIKYDREHYNLDPTTELPTTRAMYNIELSMLMWNNGDKDGACEEMRRCLRNLNCIPNIRGEGNGRAKAFYNKMMANKLPKLFSYDDILRIEKNYLKGFILEVAQMQWDNEIDSIKARNRMLANYFSSMSKSYQLQADIEANQAVSSADYDYHKETGIDFNPEKRPVGASAQRAWESCKRIHEIFCR